MELKPLHDRIIVRERKPTSVGLIFTGELIDDGLVKELIEGEVISVGPGLKVTAARRDSMWDVVPGMIVKFSPVCSVRVSGSPDLVIIRRDAIAGVLS
jgi:co-chaperonin GroES (HSP10)